MKRIIFYVIAAFITVCPLQAKVGRNIRQNAELMIPEKALKITAEIHTKQGDGSYLIVVFQNEDRVIDKKKIKIFNWISNLEKDVQYAYTIKSIERANNKIIIIVSGGKTYKVDIPGMRMPNLKKVIEWVCLFPFFGYDLNIKVLKMFVKHQSTKEPEFS